MEAAPAVRYRPTWAATVKHAVVDAVTLVAVHLLGVVFAAYFGVALAVSVARAPLSACRTRRERPYPAHLLHDPAWGEHGTVVANGVKFHYVAKGDAAAPLMLCLHGFPECWYSYRHFLARHSATHRVVAVDMRGYGETAHAEPTYLNASDYALRVLVADVRALAAAFGAATFTLVGHDWGGIVAWAYAYAHEDTLTNLIILNAPHPAAFRDTATLAQLVRSNYVFVFQLPLVPEVWLAAHDLAFLRGAFFGPAMGVRHRAPPALQEAELVVYEWAMSRAGALTAAANYYRNIFRDNVRFTRQTAGPRDRKLQVRTLLVWGEDDGALGRDSPRVTHRYVANLHLAMLPGASHWVQQDDVAGVEAAVTAFLAAPAAAPAAAAASTPAGVRRRPV